jgi:hypothetical protein
VRSCLGIAAIKQRLEIGDILFRLVYDVLLAAAIPAAQDRDNNRMFVNKSSG